MTEIFVNLQCRLIKWADSIKDLKYQDDHSIVSSHFFEIREIMTSWVKPFTFVALGVISTGQWYFANIEYLFSNILKSWNKIVNWESEDYNGLIYGSIYDPVQKGI